MGKHDWQSSRKIKLNSKKITIISIIIIFIVTIGILVGNFEIRSTIENKKPASDLPTSALQNNIIPENVSYSILKSKYVTTYSLPNGTGPNGILADSNGLVWSSGSASHTLFNLNQKDAKMTSYQIPEKANFNTMVWSMTHGKDGSIWFSQFGSTPLWRFDPSTEKFQSFQTSAAPFQMKTDEKTGNIWFTTLSGNTLGVVQTVEDKSNSLSYKITEFSLGKDTDPSGLFLKNDHVWVAELLKGNVAKFDVVKNDGGFVIAAVKKIEIPQSGISFATPVDVLVADDKKIWVTEHTPSTITEYDVSSDTMKRFPTARSAYQVSTLPFWIRESLDQKGIWFNEHQGNRVGFFNTTDNTLLEFEIPNNQAPELSPYMLNNPISPQNILDQKSYYSAIFTLNLSLDPQDSNRLWFSQWNNDKIGVVDKSKPISFDIHSNTTRVTLSSDESARKKTVDVEISRNNYSQDEGSRNPVFLSASSTMFSNGEFAKVDANFTNDTVTSEKAINLVLQNEGAKPGNYTVGISASDGLVTKTIFLDLIIVQ